MKSNQPQAVSTVPGRGAWSVLFLLWFAVAGLLVFHALWSPGSILMSSDDNVGLLRMNQRMLEASALHPWVGDALWGMPTMSMVRPGYFLLKMVPAAVFMNLYHGLCLALSAWLLALYLREKGLRPAACVFGGLVAFWVGTNLTLTYAGHVGKYGLMPFMALSVFALGRWGQTGRAAWSVVAGAAAGAMFLEQADVALFCAVLLVPVGLFEAARAAGGWKIAALAKQSWGAALVAALLAGGASLAASGSGVTESTDAQTAAERWAYITQWSQPPGESLDFIAPGWTGWRSGEEKGPYWGKMGRSEGFEQTRQGFMNFKLENVYVGAIPLLFALLGLADAFRRRSEQGPSKLVFLWGGLCGVALLLAFGKYFPLYKPLSLLPGFGSIRNPNKFIHFFQMAWGVLAAFGLETAVRMEGGASKKWQWAAEIAAVIFLVSGLALWADLGSGAARLSALGWGAAGHAIQWNKAFSVTYAGGALLVGAGILWVLKGRKPQLGAWGVWIPALVVVFDAAVILAPRYIQTMPPGYVAENDLVRYLKREVGHNRTAMATKDGFYNFWLTYLFPYQGIQTIEVTQLPRPPADYTAFWNAVRDPVRMWRLTAVSHVLAHSPVAAQLLANPAWASHLETAWAYQPMDDGRGGVSVRSMPVGANAPEVVLKMKPVPPRVAAISSWRVVADEEALKTLADPSFEPYSSVLLAPGSQVSAPPSGDPGPPAQVDITRLIPGRYEFTVANHGPIVVRVAEKYDPNWKATIDGQPAPVIRCDYMFQGLALEEAGTHQVVLKYAPSSLPILLQWMGIGAGLGAALLLVLPRRRGTGAA